MSSAHSHGSGCSSCKPVERHVIRNDDFLYVAQVKGDYDIEDDDSVVQVSVADDTNPTVPTVKLPCASELSAPHHVTVIGVGTAVNVSGSGTTGEETVEVPANQAKTFWVVDSGGEDDCGFWAPDACCAETPDPTPT